MIRADAIRLAVAEETQVLPEVMMSRSRKRRTARARQMAMYLTRTLRPELSSTWVGRQFNRDHTTVLHAVTRIEGLIAEDPAVAAAIGRITARLSHKEAA